MTQEQLSDIEQWKQTPEYQNLVDRLSTHWSSDRWSIVYEWDTSQGLIDPRNDVMWALAFDGKKVHDYLDPSYQKGLQALVEGHQKQKVDFWAFRYPELADIKAV